ncbi:MAG: SAM-dependent methyltransferase [Pseudonocardiaceae bacterium]
MTADPASPLGIDSTRPSIARGYDYLLGGKDNFEVDRRIMEMGCAVIPDLALTARLNREFGQRAVRYIAGQGIRQFIDLGSGIPTTPPSVHESARAVDPSVRVVYVDHDPVVVAYSCALRSAGPGLITVLADIRQPAAVLGHDLQAFIDFDEPVGVVIFSVLAFIGDGDDPFGIVARFRDRMAPGSFLGVSDLSGRSEPGSMAHTHRISQQTGHPAATFRTDGEMLRFFEGFELVEPGLVDVGQWRPERDVPSLRLKHVGGVGRLSRRSEHSRKPG